jgi:cytochrome P450
MSVEALAAFEAFAADPYPIYTYLRAGDPIFYFEEWGCWVATRHRTVVSLLRGAGFSSRRFDPRLLGPGASENQRTIYRIFSAGMLSTDPPDHTRLRSVVSRAFTPRMIESMRPRIQRVVDDLTDGMLQQGESEFIAQFAQPLPLIVIAEMLGVSPADRADFKRWSSDAVAFLDSNTTPEQHENCLRSLGELAAYFGTRIAELRRKPADNLLSALAAAREGGDAMSDDELVSNSLLLLAAGHETTTNLLGNGMMLLLHHPDSLKRLTAEPGLVPTAVEEFLRYESPVQWTDRTALVETEIEGARLAPGSVVLCCLGAANRDPEQFEEPDRLDIGRQENRHLAFGHGPHFCLGAALARLEGQVAFESLLRRARSLALTEEEIAWYPSRTFRRLSHLHVSFSPA